MLATIAVAAANAAGAYTTTTMVVSAMIVDIFWATALFGIMSDKFNAQS